MNLIRKRLTYANVMSTLAVFLVLGGGAAFAATQLGKNTVGTKQLKKNAVTAAKIKGGAINSAKVADGSLTGVDIADGSIGGGDIADLAIGTAKLGDNAVSTAKLGDNAVNSAKVQDKSLKGGDIADLAINTAKLGDNAVNSAKVQDKSLKGGDIADGSITGTQISEGTLKNVDAATLNGKTSTQFLSSEVYKNESAVEAGVDKGEGTFAISEGCNPGDVLLSGGPANIRSTSAMLESFSTPGDINSWTVRIQKNGQEDNWSVVVLCVKQ